MKLSFLAVLAFVSMVSPSLAYAHPRESHRPRHHHYRGPVYDAPPVYHNYRPYHHHHRSHDNIGPILGLAIAGAILGGIIYQQQNSRPRYDERPLK